MRSMPWPTIECSSSMRDLQYASCASYGMPAMLLWRMLGEWSCTRSLEAHATLFRWAIVFRTSHCPDILLAVDAMTGAAFCISCDDFIYNENVDKIRLLATIAAEEKKTKYKGGWYMTYNLIAPGLIWLGATRAPFRPWSPNTEETVMLDGMEKIPCQSTRSPLVSEGHWFTQSS